MRILQIFACKIRKVCFRLESPEPSLSFLEGIFQFRGNCYLTPSDPLLGVGHSPKGSTTSPNSVSCWEIRAQTYEPAGGGRGAFHIHIHIHKSESNIGKDAVCSPTCSFSLPPQVGLTFFIDHVWWWGRVQPQPPAITPVFAAAGRDLMVGVAIVLKTFWEPSILGKTPKEAIGLERRNTKKEKVWSLNGLAREAE